MNKPAIPIYKRDTGNRIRIWKAYIDDNVIYVKYGILGKKLHEEKIPTNRSPIEELKSLYADKQKSGYKSLSELYDNAPERLDEEDLYNYLDTYLPKNNVSSTGAILPMLCKTLEDYKPFTKTTYYGQYKINGLRCLVGATKSDDMFNPIRLTFQSREGTYWKNPLVVESELLKILPNELLDLMVEEGVKLDGELYIPGLPCSDINHNIKDSSAKYHNKLQYWIYDLAIDDTSYLKRFLMLDKWLHNQKIYVTNKEDHLNNKQTIVLLTNVIINNIDDATRHRDNFIDCGFEGLVIRNINADYGFDKRSAKYMMKYKKIYDGYFEILDIVPEGKRSELPKFILKNDINNEVFECTSKGIHDFQRTFLQMKHLYIDKKALVEYRERSGVKEVPGHAKVVKIII